MSEDRKVMVVQAVATAVAPASFYPGSVIVQDLHDHDAYLAPSGQQYVKDHPDVVLYCVECAELELGPVFPTQITEAQRQELRSMGLTDEEIDRAHAELKEKLDNEATKE